MSRGICRVVCWVGAAGAAFVFAWAVYLFVGLPLLVAAAIFVLLFVMLGLTIPEIICLRANEDPAPYVEPKKPAGYPRAMPGAAPNVVGGEMDPAPETKSAAPVAEETDAEPTAQVSPVVEAPETSSAAATGHWSETVSSESGQASDGRGQSELKPSAALSEEGSLRDGVGSWRYTSDAEPASPVEEPSEAEGDATEAEPVTLSAARDGGADDLKRIKGVGPGLEKTLNGLGFYHFDQIAAWTDAEVAWVDSRLKFKGRIVRDNWIDQAKAFAGDA